MMIRHFPKATLAYLHHRHPILDAEVEVIVADKPSSPQIKNPCLNGKLKVTGTFRYECPPGTLAIKRNSEANLILTENSKSCCLPILALDFTKVVQINRNWRSYSWEYLALARPLVDYLDLLPDGNDIDLDELAALLSLEVKVTEKIVFNGEGGFRAD
ncbi:MAG: hypothetical protein ACREGR_02065 [Minisyncoccia bacterium]